MATLTLPAVASRTYTECKKCAVERYHIVLAHTSATAAKIECEVCHAKRTFKLESPKAKAKGKSKVPSAAKAKATANAKWEEVQKVLDEKSKRPYSMKVGFTVNATIDHPKFGIGVVTVATAQSVEVVFADGIRSLVHNRPS